MFESRVTDDDRPRIATLRYGIGCRLASWIVACGMWSTPKVVAPGHIITSG